MFITLYQWFHWLRPSPPLFPLCLCGVVVRGPSVFYSFLSLLFHHSLFVCVGVVAVALLFEVTHSSCTCHVWSPNGNDDALGLVLILTSTTLGPFQHGWIWRRSWTACDSVQTSRGTGTSAFCLSFFFLFPLLPLSC